MTHPQLSPIIAPENIIALRQFIDTHNRFVVTVHMSPDGDAVGSALSFARYLTVKGKQAIIVFNDMPGENLSFIPGIGDSLCFDKQNREATAAIQEAEGFICLDYNLPARMGEMHKAVMENPAPKVLIDHHLDPDTDAFDIIISHPEMCATCELIYHVITESGDEEMIDPVMAEALYTGIMTDTGMLSYNSNRPEIYLVAAHLLATGFDKEYIHRSLAAEKERRLRLKGYVLDEKMKIIYPHHAAYICLSKAEMKKYDHQKGDSEGFVNMPLAIPEVVCAAFFREEANFVKVSLRSKNDYPVNLLAEKFFNGGGHKNAAGGEFYGSLQQAELLFVKILPLFAKYLNA